MDAILNANLESSLFMEKWYSGSDFPPAAYIRYHLNDINACIWGRKFNRKLFKSVAVDRWHFQKWCEMYKIPLPEFWFPPGWNLIPDFSLFDDNKTSDGEADNLANKDESDADKESRLRASRKARAACEQIAEILWKEQPDLNIANMVKHEHIQKYGGAHYENETVRSWIKDLAPPEIKGKRGRPKKD
ncbi:MAG: hypothetical protein ACXVBQ_17470 [Pseudobdellovibrionaceae bacterium]